MINMEKSEGVSFEKEPFETELRARKDTSGKIALMVTLGLLILGALLAFFLITSLNNKKPETVPDVGSTVSAQQQCENFVKEKVGNPANISFTSQPAIQDTRFPTHYQVVGFVEFVSNSGASGESSYRCDLTYSPETQEWTSDTLVNRG